MTRQPLRVTSQGIRAEEEENEDATNNKIKKVWCKTTVYVLLPNSFIRAGCAFFNGGNTEGTNSCKSFCLMFVYVFCIFVSGLILWFWDSLWFDYLRVE